MTVTVSATEDAGATAAETNRAERVKSSATGSNRSRAFSSSGYDSEQFKRDAAEQLEKYNGEIERLMTTYKVRTEAELFVLEFSMNGVTSKSKVTCWCVWAPDEAV